MRVEPIPPELGLPEGYAVHVLPSLPPGPMYSRFVSLGGDMVIPTAEHRTVDRYVTQRPDANIGFVGIEQKPNGMYIHVMYMGKRIALQAPGSLEVGITQVVRIERTPDKFGPLVERLVMDFFNEKGREIINGILNSGVVKLRTFFAAGPYSDKVVVVWEGEAQGLKPDASQAEIIGLAAGLIAIERARTAVNTPTDDVPPEAAETIELPNDEPTGEPQ